MKSRIRAIQRSYPIVWHRCHTGHTGRRSALSDREAMVLQHLSGGSMPPRVLARHLGIAASTLSEVVNKLVARELVERKVDSDDKRRVTYEPTAAGEAEIDAASPLAYAQLERALGLLDEEQQVRAVEGLNLLADACRRLGDA